MISRRRKKRAPARGGRSPDSGEGGALLLGVAEIAAARSRGEAVLDRGLLPGVEFAEDLVLDGLAVVPQFLRGGSDGDVVLPENRLVAPGVEVGVQLLAGRPDRLGVGLDRRLRGLEDGLDVGLLAVAQVRV